MSTLNLSNIPFLANVKSIDRLLTAVRVGPAFAMLVFGFSQLINPLSWLQIIPSFLQTSGMSPVNIIRLIALINILLAILLLTTASIPVTLAVIIWWALWIPSNYMTNWSAAILDIAVVITLLGLLSFMM